MEVEHIGNTSNSSQPNSSTSQSPDNSEPARKKRCVRFSSDITTEDPLIISDSGFGDLSSSTRFGEENGDLEVSSFFGVGESRDPGPSSHSLREVERRS